jgi:large subunit ribosomal protein L13
MADEITIDAKGESFGRVASKVAVLLQGKHTPAFLRHQDKGAKVVVENISQIRFTGKKLTQKVYYKHTKHVGHVKETKLGELFAKDPARAFRQTVYGMLPKNKLRRVWIKKLTILP